MKIRKPIYEAIFDGMFSQIETHKDGEEEYEKALNAIELGFEEYSYNRAKVVKLLREDLKRQIKDLRYCLKTIK